MKIKKVAVIGAGTMGAGIAGQAANAGCDVLLLDLPSDGQDVNALAQKGLDRISNPADPGIISAAAGARITVGNIRDDFNKLADCDWIAEAILERLDLKKNLYKKLDAVCKSDAIISSNTSTIPIKLLVEDMPLAFRKRFAITHFFNPVRFMPLLELVAGEDTDPAVMAVLHEFCDKELGKGVVPCRDTPGFLGNRVGCYAIQTALHTAFEMGLSPQEADAIFGRPMGIPKTGVFGLYDLIGIDLMSDVATSLVSILPDGDAFHAVGAKLPLMENMIANGQRGRKSGAGFYRIKDGEKQVINLETGTYEPAKNLNIPVANKAEKEGIIHVLEADGHYGDYAWSVMSRVLLYAASLVPEVGDNPVAVDDAMKMGYNWIKGPFELIDEITPDYLIGRLESELCVIPDYLKQAAGSSFYDTESSLKAREYGGGFADVVRPDGTLRFNDRRKTLTPVNANSEASWYNVDDVALVEFHSKANALGAGSMSILEDALETVASKKMRGLVVHNDAQHFSCGVNLNAVRAFFEAEDWDGLDAFLNHFQQTCHKMAVAEFPVIAAPVGLSLGGGFEVVLHAKQVICHANSNMGLVESGVGVIPAGGGCKETLYRWIDKKNGDVTAAAWEAFYALGYGKTASSPVHARDLAMLRDNDRYVNNRDRLFSEAMAAIADPTEQRDFSRDPIAMAGRDEFAKMVKWAEDMHAKGKLFAHDVFVSTEIARIVT
ncbi:MAG: 3-hydroxyacyl-CoA dehydrogenase/enoyl-CoA hydratase family protein, partial [Hyphomonadaceae bacterium]|nr:3-hydroxyacyl-CoA dehydrogenase/enoyl-CoA hydratase family protein [Hyphomonadaceae bacterium]